MLKQSPAGLLLEATRTDTGEMTSHRMSFREKKPLIVLGILTIVIGGIFVVVGPAIGTQVTIAVGSAASTAAYHFLASVVSLVAAIAPPLGAGLLVAGLVLEPRRRAQD